jgi:hypothetical protein
MLESPARCTGDTGAGGMSGDKGCRGVANAAGSELAIVRWSVTASLPGLDWISNRKGER